MTAARATTRPAWRDRLELSTGVAGHSPVVKGTFIRADLIVRCLAGGLSPDEVRAVYPVMPEDIAACIAWHQETKS